MGVLLSKFLFVHTNDNMKHFQNQMGRIQGRALRDISSKEQS